MLVACVKAPFLLRRPPLNSSLFTRLAHSSKSTSNSSPSERTDAVNNVARVLFRAALQPQPRSFQKFDDDKRFRGKFKYLVYSAVLEDLLKTSYFPAAALVYKIMPPAYRSPSINARMLAAAIANSVGEPHESLIIPFIFLSSHDDITEDIFMEIIRSLVIRKVKPKILLRLVNYYIGAQADSFVPTPDLAAIWIRAKFLTEGADAALAALKEYSILSTSRDLLPYTTILSTINDVSPDDADSVEQILLIMDKAQLTLDLTVFNALLRREYKLEHSSSAFAVYASLKDVANRGVLPDEETYAMLFSLLRDRRPRLWKRPPPGFYPPRALFRDMIGTTMHQERPLVLSSKLLTVVLRAFLKHRDYAAALVVVHVLDQYDLDVPMEIFYVTVKHIVRRVWAEIRGKRILGEETWSDKFLGSSAPADKRGLKVLEELLSEALVDKILDFTRQEEMDVYNVRFLESLPVNVPVYSAPTMGDMEGVKDVLPEAKYHTKPLERLLERSLFATFTGPQQELEALQNAVQAARVEMIPST